MTICSNGEIGDRKRVFSAVLALALTACFLTACGAPAAKGEESTPAVTAAKGEEPTSAVAAPEAASDDASQNALPARVMLPDLDVSALEAAMPEEDWAAFEAYLPILQGEQTFRWAAGPYRGYPDYDWETRDATLADYHDALWEGSENGSDRTDALELDRLAVQDIDGNGGAELILLFRDMGYNYLVLHQAEDAVYGTDFSVRWFEGLQKNGVYIGSSGSDDNAYYQMAFRNGRFEQQELGHKEGSQCEIAGKAVTEKAFEAWKAETMVGDVTWYTSAD